MLEPASRILEAAERRRKEAAHLLSELVRIPSLSGDEGRVVAFLKDRMSSCFDRVEVDRFGNVRAWLGREGPLIAFDAHVDTVDVGDRSLWTVSPFAGVVRDGYVLGRGAADQKGGMAAILIAAEVLRDLESELPFRFLAVGSVQEEDCDGLCWQYIIGQEGLRPDFVVITEPTALAVHLGHRGRVEMRIHFRGRSAHAAMPERGKNAVYGLARTIRELESLSTRLASHEVLGKGTLAVTACWSRSPSLCAVPDSATCHVDRRLTWGEDEWSSVGEIEGLPSVRESGARVEVLEYDRPTHTAYELRTKKYYPAWLLAPDSPLARAAIATHVALFGKEPRTGYWRFSTNGVATSGMFGVPTVGFGPGDERFAHAPDERCPVDEIVRAAAFYAMLGFAVVDGNRQSGGG